MNAGQPRLVPCPRCGAPSPWTPSNAWRPFCSQRCSEADLGAWASESYRLPETDPTPDSDDEPSLP